MSPRSLLGAALTLTVASGYEYFEPVPVFAVGVAHPQPHASRELTIVLV